MLVPYHLGDWVVHFKIRSVRPPVLSFFKAILNVQSPLRFCMNFMIVYFIFQVWSSSYKAHTYFIVKADLERGISFHTFPNSQIIGMCHHAQHRRFPMSDFQKILSGVVLS